MMNIRNFHLKSAFINFNSEELDLNFSKQIPKNSKSKLDKSLPKPSQSVETKMKNFKLTTNFYQKYNQNDEIKKPHTVIFEFQPPTIYLNKKAAKYMSCTLSPKKSSEKLTSPYQIYKSSLKDRHHHKRRFSDTHVSKKLHQRIKKQINNESDPLHNPQALKQNHIENKIFTNHSNQMILNFNKTINKIKVFEVENLFSWNQNQKIIHSGKNGSSFITTLPSKKKNFRTVRSSSLKERKPEANISVQKEKDKTFVKDSQLSSEIYQKYDDYKRSIHTAGSITARRIDMDKLSFTPVSTGFFPQSSIWNKEEQFVKHTQIKPRSYKLLEKPGTGIKQNNKAKDNPCRPWSPSRPQSSMLQLQEQEAFPEIKQH